jgi:hypothetical protein
MSSSNLNLQGQQLFLEILQACSNVAPVVMENVPAGHGIQSETDAAPAASACTNRIVMSRISTAYEIIPSHPNKQAHSDGPICSSFSSCQSHSSRLDIIIIIIIIMLFY